MSFEPINVACLGMGWWSDVLADAMVRSGRLRIRACYSRSEDKRKALFMLSSALERARITAVLASEPLGDDGEGFDFSRLTGGAA